MLYQNSLLVAEVKAYTSYIRNTAEPGSAVPTDPSSFNGMGGDLKLGPDVNSNTGHTEWPDGRVHHSGITTTLTLNTVVPYDNDGQIYDIDFNPVQEGKAEAKRRMRRSLPEVITLVWLTSALPMGRRIRLPIRSTWKLGERWGRSPVGDDRRW